MNTGNAVVAADLLSPEELAGVPAVQSAPKDFPARQLSGLETKALELLGSGQTQEVVASTLGVTPGRISQLMAAEDFAALVQAKRYDNLQKHNKLDAGYDSAEQKLQDKLLRAIPLMFKSQEILRALQVVNMAKRKGAPVQPVSTNAGTNQVVSLTLPVQIINKFSTNLNNQILEANGQSLVTVTPAMLAKVSNETKELQDESSNARVSKSGIEIKALASGRAVCPEDLI